jgi:hypothetical protein
MATNKAILLGLDDDDDYDSLSDEDELEDKGLHSDLKDKKPRK